MDKAALELWKDRADFWALIFAFVVGVGVVGEFIAHFAYRYFSRELEPIISGEDRQLRQNVADADRELAQAIRLMAAREIIAKSASKKLSAFTGTPLWVASIDWSRDKEAHWFAGSFRYLEFAAGWQFHSVVDPITVGPGMEGVTVYSWRPSLNGKPILNDDVPLAPDSPEKKAWAAADALVAYLRDDLGLTSTVHWVIPFKGPRGYPFDTWDPFAAFERGRCSSREEA
jgi:hypothetical protein